ncbi:hypothetical protein CYLTODRAFT_452532 [Cylindrobasidium torrendii FP15055 ss-10]|uniref:Uncharacterized protein n=1 Tax=Cylindrobasidium torrendii FP15055 ss-10 TaxID=1314674 RepID=A0A0D7BIS3_9AGAR|nr:hypothetical protein CYLTODRAFT_452532 [Cylindrobasidium torrendii FP15055 ss-10]
MQKQNNKDRRIGLYLNVAEMKAAFPSAIARAFESDKEFALSKQRQKEHYESVEQQHEFAEAQARRQLELEAKKAAVPRAPAHYSIIMDYAEKPTNSFKVGNDGVRPVRGVTPAFPVVSRRKDIPPRPQPPPGPPPPAPVGAGGGSLHVPGKFAQPRRQHKIPRVKTTASLRAACEKALPPLPPPSPLVVASFDNSRNAASSSSEAAKAARPPAESHRVNDARRKRPHPAPTESKPKVSSRGGNGQSPSTSTQLSTSTTTTAPFVNFFRPSLPQSETSSTASSVYIPIALPTPSHALPTPSQAPSRPKPKAPQAPGAPITTAQISAAHREQTRRDISSRIQILVDGAEPDTKPPPTKKIPRKPVDGLYPGKNALLFASVQGGAMSSKTSSGSLNTEYSVYSQLSGSNVSERSMSARRA